MNNSPMLMGDLDPEDDPSFAVFILICILLASVFFFG